MEIRCGSGLATEWLLKSGFLTIGKFVMALMRAIALMLAIWAMDNNYFSGSAMVTPSRLGVLMPMRPGCI